MMLQPKIECAYTKLVPITEINPNPRNPNKHSDSQIELLAKIIKEQGFRASITVSNRSGFVVRGHGRLLAAKKLELAEVPVDFQDYESDELEIADLLADNKIAELANLDIPSAASLIQGLDSSNFDLDFTGFNEIELDSFLSECLDCDKCENREKQEDIEYISSAKKREVKDVDINSFDHYVVAFSGGKDSTALLLWALDNLPKEKIIVQHWSSGWVFPEEWEYVKYIINKYQVKTILIGEKTKDFVFNTIKRKGYPFYGNLWCQTEFKLKHVRCMQRYYMEPKYGTNILELVGIRCSESSRRKDYPLFYRSQGGIGAGISVERLVYVPIKDFTDEDLISYIKSKKEKISPLYRFFDRTGCVFCANNSTFMIDYIRKNMPKDLCDMNYALALDMKQNPNYIDRSIDLFFKFNLHKKNSRDKKKKQSFFKEIAFKNMDFAKNNEGYKDYIIDLRGKIPWKVKGNFILEA